MRKMKSVLAAAALAVAASAGLAIAPGAPQASASEPLTAGCKDWHRHFNANNSLWFCNLAYGPTRAWVYAVDSAGNPTTYPRCYNVPPRRDGLVGSNMDRPYSFQVGQYC